MSKIFIYPDAILKKISQEINFFDEKLEQLSEIMLAIMENADGIGLAAPQIGILQRIFVMDLKMKQADYPKVFINPKIEQAEGAITYEEGCLSIPNIRAEITRKENIMITYQNLKGEQKKIQASQLAAVCIQHEVDHLNGVLFWDYLSPLNKKFLLNKYKKML